MSEQADSEEIKNIQEAYHSIETMFEGMEIDPDHLNRGTHRRKVLADGAIIRIHRSMEDDESSGEPEGLYVEVDRDKYPNHLVVFTMFPESIRLHDLARPRVKLGNLEIGSSSIGSDWLLRYPQVEEAPYRPYKPNPVIQSVVPILVDWVYQMYTQNKRVPLKFSSEL